MSKAVMSEGAYFQASKARSEMVSKVGSGRQEMSKSSATAPVDLQILT